MTLFLAILISGIASALTPLEKNLKESEDAFFLFPRVKQITQQLKASAAVAYTASNDRGLNIAADLSKSKSPTLSDSRLIDAGGVYPTSQSKLSSSLTFGLRNMGYLNSTELQLQSSWLTRDWQKVSNTIPTIDSYKSYSLKLSYDVINGAYSDSFYLQNKTTEYSEYATMISTADTLVRNFLDYKYLLLDIYASYCKLKTSNDDLTIIEKVVKEIKLSHELKSIPYKQYLNVMDTINFIQRNNINYDLGYQSNLQRLYFWSDLPLEEWEQRFIGSIKCPVKTEQFKELTSEKMTEIPTYPETILAAQTKSTASALKYNYLYDKQRIKPSIRPYVEMGQDDSAGYDNKTIAMGVSFAWNAPSEKNQGQVLGSYYKAGAGQLANVSNERQFESLIKTYNLRFDKSKELLTLSLRSLENSNSLVQLLEVQKSIGQVDSVSLSNAYTQRNQILNNLFDSMINLEKTKLEVHYLKNWKELIVRAGINIR